MRVRASRLSASLLNQVNANFEIHAGHVLVWGLSICCLGLGLLVMCCFSVNLVGLG